MGKLDQTSRGRRTKRSQHAAATTANVNVVIRVEPLTGFCTIDSQSARIEPACANSGRRVLTLEPHHKRQLCEVLDEIVQSTAQPGAGSATCAELTGRQREIVELVRRGASNKLIARDLGLSVGTVKVHMRRIFRALGVSSRVQLAMLPPAPE